MSELTDKQKKFCEEFLIDFNGTQAAIRAGYSKKTAFVQASRLLSNAKVSEYLDVRRQRIMNKLEISQERTMQEIGRIAFSDIRKLFNENGELLPFKDLDEDSASVLASVETEELFEGTGKERHSIGVSRKIKLHNKVSALEMLAKHFKIFSDAPTNNNTIKFGYGEEKPV